MPAKVFFQEIPGNQTMALTHPAYFDRTRPLVHPEALAKLTFEGWVFAWPDETEHGVEQIILREDSGDLESDDGDVWFPDGQTIYAEAKEDFEAWASAKALFELSRPFLQPPLGTGITTEMLDHWRMNCHFQDFDGLVEIACKCVGDCDLKDVPIDRYFRDAWEWIA